MDDERKIKFFSLILPKMSPYVNRYDADTK